MWTESCVIVDTQMNPIYPSLYNRIALFSIKIVKSMRVYKNYQQSYPQVVDNLFTESTAIYKKRHLYRRNRFKWSNVEKNVEKGGKIMGKDVETGLTRGSGVDTMSFALYLYRKPVRGKRREKEQ